jgi:N6-L-threonylcarbamoyladenine synthase
MSSPLILAIDTSCDDTSAAVVQGRRVLSNVISSQDAVHREFGGVVPMLAKRQHLENFTPVVKLALKRAKVTSDDIEMIAVTRGPGLAPALEVGVTLAAELGEQWKKPVYGINHLEGHLWSALAQRSSGTQGWEIAEADFPLLGLIVSGGHTEMFWVTGIGQYERLGGTVDDAFGEAFDKAARLLGLGYPGGAALAKLAEKGNSLAYKLPRPMRLSGDWNVSYSGLKTALVRLVAEITNDNTRPLNATEIQDLAASFQAAAVDTFVHKVKDILKKKAPRHILLGGGAAANIMLRQSLRTLARAQKATLHTPTQARLLKDNAAMIGLVASLRLQENLPLSSVLDRLPSWKLETV